MSALHHLASVLLERLVWTSIQATLLIAIVFMIVRLLPQLPARIRCMLWWLVSLQLVLGLCWHAPMSLPLLAPPSASTPIVRIAIPATHSVDASPIHASSGPSMSAAATTTTIPWREALPLLWLAAMLAQLPLLARQWQRTRQLLGSAEPLANASLQALCMQRAKALGLRRCPPLYVCADIDSPQVSGLRRPVVLLPAVHAMTPAETAMAIAHELAHLRRGDLWLGWLPAIARRLFFFHPLATWAMREYALEREAACDAEVLQQTGTMPQAYAQLLLRLGVSHPLHAGLAGASPTFQNLKRRLIMLQHIDPVSRRHLRGWLMVALVAIAGVLPYRVTAASDKHTDAAPPAPASAVEAPLPPAPPMHEPGVPTPMAPLPPLAPTPPMAPLQPLAPTPPMPPTPPAPPPHANEFSAHHVNIDTSNDSSTGFALFDGDANITINGSEADLDTVKKLHAKNKSMVWFRRGSAAYLIHDKSTLERASRIYAPVTTLAREQGELAGQQGELAGKQAGLAARDASFAGEEAQLAGRQAAVDAQTAAMESMPGGQKTDDRQRELERRKAEMDAEQARVEQRHAGLEAELAAQRKVLDTRQASLDQQQQALEQKQQKATQAAEQAMSQLLDEALTKGLAEKTSLR